MSLTITPGYDTVVIPDDLLQALIKSYITQQTGRACVGWVDIETESRQTIGTRREKIYTATATLESKA